MPHGKACMPWGKYRGLRIRLLPDDYLSWLTTSVMMTEQRWWWLRVSVLAELKHRGLHWEGAALADVVAAEAEQPATFGVRRFRE
jgi:uncharacterized protein (DUF3820 family)